MLRSICKLLCAIASIALLDVVAFTPGLALTQEQLNRCDDKTDVAPRRRVRACTAIIKSGIFSGKDLAPVFNNRGLLYQMIHEYARSIADFDEAIRLDPVKARAFYNRAYSVYLKINYDRAIADVANA